ncbi:MAG: GGDEF domain-containing protein [Gammaproteobacteria bacterium]|nr:GGDEF domain-containing protein [Gammaproteobacteria bacterium]
MKLAENQMETDIETELEIRLWERRFPVVRNTLLAASFLFLVFLGWDVRVDPSGVANTLPERLLGAGCFALMYVLVAFTRIGGRHLKLIYVSGVLLSVALILVILLQIEGAYLLGHGSFLAIAMAVAVIGPTLRVSIPLVIAVLLVPGTVVLWLAHGSAALPGVPDHDTAVNLAYLDLGVGALVVLLLVANDGLQRRMLMDNLHYEQLAGTDPLTAVQNRRQLQAEFARERARQRRHGRPIGVLEIDIDHFKWVNDAHGHGVGDEVLRSLTQRWRGLIREVDILARIGGEEFVVLLPESSADGARDSAERLRAYTAAEPVSTSVGALSVTVSIGVALAAVDDGDLDTVLNRVDRALYRAKENGRNRCEFADPAVDVGRKDGMEPG